jgi:hypothetical protein
MLTRRLQVLVEPAQYDSLEREAARRGVSVGEVVRIGIDVVCDPNRQARAEAIERLFALPPLDDPDELEAELDAMYDA